MKGNNNSLDGIKNVTIYTPEGLNHILRKIDKDVIKVIKEWLVKYEFKREKYKM